MDRVRLTQGSESLPTHSQWPLRPHPVFPQWSPWSVYPYLYYGSMTHDLERRNYFMPALENEFLRVSVAADIGGRVWDVFDKVGGRHIINFNNKVQTYNAGFGLNYTCAGLECNYPQAHACTTSRKREVSFRRGEDGSSSIVCSELDLIWRTRWSVTYTLYPGRSFLELKVRVYNRTPLESRYMYWNNCGVYANKDTQFIIPEREGAMHGQERTTFSWPMWRRRDLSRFGQIPPEMLGLYMLDARDPFFGCYDHAEDHGLVHYADLADLPGKKMWTWGSDPGYCGMLSQTHSGVGKVYVEVQSGRIVIQEHLDRVPPETEMEWKEIWYPVRGTGAFNGAGRGAALRAEVVERGAAGSKVKVTAMGNGAFPGARLEVCSDGAPPVSRAFALDATRVSTAVVAVKGLAGPDRKTRVVVRDASGEVLARCRLLSPNRRDCWREAADTAPITIQASAEHAFVEAERKARDWGNHDLKPLYEKALALDPGFSAAHRELGKLALWRGEASQAAESFAKAMEHDQDGFELKYWRGLALVRAGKTEDGRKWLEMSCRNEWEAPALARLAELRMSEGDFHHALEHLDRLAASRPRLTRPRGLRAACLRRLGRRREAAAEIAQALALDGLDPFLRFEAMFVEAGAPRAAKLTKAKLKELLEQTRHDEQPLVEAAFDYLAAGLFEEALAVSESIPAGWHAELVKAWSLHRMGREAEALRALRKAMTTDMAEAPPWRLELLETLDWARQALPRSGRPDFLAGSILMARRRAGEGVAAWRAAAAKGEKHWLLFSNLGYYSSSVAKDNKAALAWFGKAEKANPGDLYVQFDSAALLAEQSPAQAARYLERRMAAVKRSPKLAGSLLGAYLKMRQYGKFDALCGQLDFRHNHQLPGPHHLWPTRHLQEAVLLLNEGKPREALERLRTIENPCPPRLGKQFAFQLEHDRRLYHMGRCYEKMGDAAQARACWEQAAALPHHTGYETAYWIREWTKRYYQALSLAKLGRASEANAFFDAMELLAQTPALPLAARQAMLDLVERGRFAPDDEKDPVMKSAVAVATRAEE